MKAEATITLEEAKALIDRRVTIEHQARDGSSYTYVGLVKKVGVIDAYTIPSCPVIHLQRDAVDGGFVSQLTMASTEASSFKVTEVQR